MDTRRKEDKSLANAEGPRRLKVWGEEERRWKSEDLGRPCGLPHGPECTTGNRQCQAEPGLREPAGWAGKPQELSQPGKELVDSEELMVS